jgi:hypothetical protein
MPKLDELVVRRKSDRGAPTDIRRDVISRSEYLLPRVTGRVLFFACGALVSCEWKPKIRRNPMPKYIFAYHGGTMPDSPEEGAKLMASWQAWLGDLGPAVISPGNPVGKSTTVSSSGVTNDGGANPLSGFSIVLADGLDHAVDMAKRCPHIDHGTIEIAEMMEM